MKLSVFGILLVALSMASTVSVAASSNVVVEIVDAAGHRIHFVWLFVGEKGAFSEFVPRVEIPALNGVAVVPRDLLLRYPYVAVGIAYNYTILGTQPMKGYTVLEVVPSATVLSSHRIVLRNATRVSAALVTDSGEPVRGVVELQLVASASIGFSRVRLWTENVSVSVSGRLALTLPTTHIVIEGVKTPLRLRVVYRGHAAEVPISSSLHRIVIDMRPPRILSVVTRIAWTTVFGTRCLGLWITVSAVDPGPLGSGVANVSLLKHSPLEVSRLGNHTWSLFAFCTTVPGTVFSDTLVVEDAQGNKALRKIRVVMTPPTASITVSRMTITKTVTRTLLRTVTRIATITRAALPLTEIVAIAIAALALGFAIGYAVGRKR